ncbi:hypothetical protein ACH5RR_000008 [Cinchona calisaya]|uniref:Uncharacterized protein n=1 Tax=Cinchona calisaya TaxID=153742 RepID=A0ABD3AZF6_9GENT
MEEHYSKKKAERPPSSWRNLEKKPKLDIPDRDLGKHVEGEKSSDNKSRIYVFMDDVRCCETNVQVVEVNLGGVGDGVYGPSVRILKNFPFQPSGVSFGSDGKIIYGVGGIHDIGASYLNRFWYCEISNPEKGWVAGPGMLSTRAYPNHQVINGKLYVMGGCLGVLLAEYLDLSRIDEGKEQCGWTSYSRQLL